MQISCILLSGFKQLKSGMKILRTVFFSFIQLKYPIFKKK